MVNGERLRQARELRGLTQIQLADLVHIQQPLVAQIEGGEKQPSERILAAIALATGFPPSFFKQLNGPDFPAGSLLFRARAFVGKLQKARAHRYAEVLYEAIEKMEKRIKTLPLRLPRVVGSPTEAARITRSELGVSVDGGIEPLQEALSVITLSGPISSVVR